MATKKEKKAAEESVETTEKTQAKKSPVTYVGPGNAAGEYLFAEVPGSITAQSLEEATKIAEERYHQGYRR
jgi:hypothetical protein